MLVVAGAVAGCQRGGEHFSQTDNDFSSIGNALEMYRLNGGCLPSTEQGLAALVERPEGLPVPQRWFRICDKVPLDPWGRPYRYRCLEPATASDPGYDIWSMGPDGISGTADDRRKREFEHR